VENNSFLSKVYAKPDISLSQKMAKQDIKNCSLEDLSEFFRDRGYSHFYAKQIFAWVYKRGIENFNLMTDISKEARRFFEKIFYFSHLCLLKREISKDRTEKFLFQLSNGSKIETVLIPEEKRNTLCVSTQVGCKFGCKFCVSGLRGFKRNLSVSEIINQYLDTKKLAEPKKITNIVFMGVGEPLDNFDNVVKSIKILMESCGVYFGKRRICISTIGMPSKIKKLADLNLRVKLSVSLHSADPFKREKLMPATKRYSLADLIKAIKYFSYKEKFPVTFEYIMIRGVNSSKEDAYNLVKLVKNVNSKVNLIPYNPSTFFKWQTPPNEEIEQFKKILKKHNVFFTLRKPRGQDIHASCGQLRAEFDQKPCPPRR
jgi:23S rRNA (adenine2503-C2)-methyltransferase